MTEVALIAGNDETREVLRALLRLHHHPGAGRGAGERRRSAPAQVGIQGRALRGRGALGRELDRGPREREGIPASVPSVLVSPFYGAEFEEKARKLGVGAILLRPFEIPELLDVIARVDGARSEPSHT